MWNVGTYWRELLLVFINIYRAVYDPPVLFKILKKHMERKIWH